MNSVFVREPEAGNYGKGGRRPAGRAPCRALLRNMYKKRVAFLYTIMYYHTNVVKTPLKTPRKNGFAAIPIRELLRIHIITVRKRPCGCVRSVFVFRGRESRRDHNRIPEGPQRNPGGTTTESRRDYNTEHNRTQAIAVRLREMGILRFKED